MNLTPIPLIVLNDTITYSKRLKSDRGNIFDNEIIIKNVRVDFDISSSSKYEIYQRNEKTTFKGMIFIDFKNSKPFIIPNVYDKIIFNNIDYIVSRCDILKPFGEVHHLEVYIK